LSDGRYNLWSLQTGFAVSGLCAQVNFNTGLTVHVFSVNLEKCCVE